MRKNFTAFIPVFIMSAVAIICVLAYLVFTGKLLKFTKDKQVENVQSENDVILSESELPRMDASVSLQDMMTAVTRNFTQDNSISSGRFNYSDTDEAYRKLINGELDIIFATFPSDDIFTMASANGIEFDIIPIAKEGLVFLVNSDNPVSLLSVLDVQKIYTGQIANWSDVDGESQEIRAFQRVNNSITQNAMISLVMKNLQMTEPRKKTFYDKNLGNINDLVENYDNSKNAIGYSFYRDAQIMYNLDDKIDNGVKLLKINNVEPNYENIHNGSYPIQMNYYLVKNKENNYENVQLFINAMLSDRGKKVIKEAGYIDN